MSMIIEFLDRRPTADRYTIDVVGAPHRGRVIFDGYVPPAAAQTFQDKVGTKGRYEFEPAGPDRVLIDANVPVSA